MPDYRRALIRGGTLFFTVVTYNRLPLFASEETRALLKAAYTKVQERFPFGTDAICLLPDHIHCIWSLPEGDANYSLRWGEIKKQFTIAYHKGFTEKQPRNLSRWKRGESTVWQRRFWEHTIRDLDDYHKHIDYIHYNPVKHGLANSPADWSWSSFGKYVKMGYYAGDWGLPDEDKTSGDAFGE
jgi:putative transposase